MIFQLRIGDRTHYDLEYVKALVEEIVKHGKPYDEVWLATSYALPSLDNCRESAEKMKQAAKLFKEGGITVSMQISRTLGHANIKMNMGGIDGKKVNCIRHLNGVEAGGRFCFNCEGLREYLYEAMKIYATVKPFIIWIDDDLRLRAPGGKGRSLCFCETCIAKYNKQYNRKYDINSLREDFTYRSEIRNEYIEFQINSVSSFAQLLAEAIHCVSPETIVGLQGGVDTPLAAKTEEHILQSIYEVTGKEPVFRAGGGFYDDHNPKGMLDKVLKINFANARLPEIVKYKSCEIENLPFVSYGKSNEGTGLEAALYCAYGCNMASITLMCDNESMEYVGKQLDILSDYKRYLEKTITHNIGTVNGGVTVYQSENCAGRVGCGTDENWDNPYISDCADFLRLGIPINYEKDAPVFFLAEAVVDGLGDDEIDKLLKKNVITEARAVEKIIDRGFGTKLPISVKPIDEKYNWGTFNVMSDHKINEGLAHRRWNDTIYYSRETQYVINGEKLEPVMETYAQQFLGGELLGYYAAIIETAYGSKWFVKGKNLVGRVLNFDMRQQLRKAIDYISGAKLPAYLDCEGQVAVIPRVDREGKTVSVTLLNISVEDYANMRLVINNPAGESECRLVSPHDEDAKLSLVKEGESYSVEIPLLRGWRIKTLLIR